MTVKMKTSPRYPIFWTFIYVGLLGMNSVSAYTQCKKVVWMTSLAGQTTRYTELMRVALHSAALKAPSIKPVIVAEEATLAMPEMHRFAMFAKSKGAIVTTHTLTFLRDFEPDSHPYKVRGTFLRLECGFIFKRLIEEKRLDTREVDTEYVLYADSDIMFLQDMNSCTLPQPAIALFGPETQRGIPANAGILYINVSAWNSEHAAIVKHGRSRNWDFVSLDQGLLLDFYSSRLEALPDYFNWKGYWGHDEGAVILHFHGPKPGPCLECLCTHSIGKTTEACKREACKGNHWPEFYTMLTVDEGSYFKSILILYYRYLADNLSMQYSVSIDRDEVPVGK